VLTDKPPRTQKANWVIWLRLPALILKPILSTFVAVLLLNEILKKGRAFEALTRELAKLFASNGPTCHAIPTHASVYQIHRLEPLTLKSSADSALQH
jgi:hypothetical protein